MCGMISQTDFNSTAMSVNITAQLGDDGGGIELVAMQPVQS